MDTSERMPALILTGPDDDDPALGVAALAATMVSTVHI